MRATIIIALFFLLHCGNIFSQSSTYHFKHYNINSGLSLNTVMTLFQDSKGFIWIGTKNGLNRFDGYDFKIYRRNRSASGPSNSIIYYIIEDQNQTLWIATDKGISLYNPLTECFQDFDAKTESGESIKSTVHRIFIDKQNRVWIYGSNKAYLYTPSNNKLTCLNEKFKPFTSVTPAALYVEANGMAYIGFAKVGILQYNATTDKISFLCSFENTPTAISGYKDNQLLIGTMNRGVWTIDKTNGVKNKLPVDTAINSNIYVRDIREVSEKEYWIASESGIYILKGNDIQHLAHEEFNDNSLSDNAIYTILRDREGGTWIGSYFGGVDYIPAQYSYFENFYPVPYKNSLNGYRVRELISDKQGNLWIATEDKGLNYFDVNEKTFTHITSESSPLKVSFTNIQCLNIKEDELWVGTFTKGIDVLNLKTKQHRHYEKSASPNSLTNNEVFAIFTDRNNTTWIGVTTGVFVYEPQIDGFRAFNKVNAHVSDIDEDSQGNIWFTTYHQGVFRYTPYTKEVKNFRYDMDNPKSLCYDRITDVFLDSKDRLWFASEDGGFCLYNKESETFTSITTEQGLPSNVIYKMLEDDNHYLWLSTNNGLVKFNPETMAIESLYNSSNGLQSKQFNYNSGTKTVDGTLYFGSINGFVAFNPKNFHPNDRECRVILTDLYVSNRRVTVGEESNILTKAMPYENTIRLNYDQSTFGFNFSALNYSTEENGKYVYRLENIEKQWTYTDNANRVSYNSIPPGQYTFCIKYSKDGHTWNGQETRIKIHIIPPFWQTSWAYTLYILLIIGILFMLIRIYTRKKKRQMEEQLAHQEHLKKEEIYKAKIEFFTSIAHEIRTPITLIKAPLDYIIHSRPDEQEVQENLVTMEQNTDRLLELVNQLLDFRKIESEAFTLSPEIIDVQELVSNIYNRFIPTAKQRNLKMSLECPPHSVMAFIDKEAITKVCSNLFNNAVKYSSTCIKVSLTESKNKKIFQIAVRNDGKPIPNDLKQNIFEAFFQIKDNDQPAQPGSGIGLTLASSLVQLHHGKLYLDDKAKETSFIIQIPTNIPADIEENKNEPEYENVSQKKEAISFDPENPNRATILVVEDHDELRSLLAKQLGKRYQIITADNGIEAITVLEKEIINLIVSDVMMPLMDGLELCQTVKESLETCHIPIILLTAKTTLNNRIDGLKSGADAYIEKPFSMPHLLIQIDNLLENRAKLLKNFASKPYVATGSIAKNKTDELFLNKLTEIIKQNIEDDTFNIDNLSSEMSMSRASLHRKIKGLTELTPGDFIRIIRLRKAAELLLEGELRISEICLQVGINSLSHFSKSFQKQFGVLPKDFVKSQTSKKSI